ncbi:MAG: thioesterase [Chloroflexi bacterium]|nr:thioesterase [Chloroflexota bacterium]
MPNLPDTIQPGMKNERHWVVADYMLYAPGGDPARNTLSSPSMINEMETTAMLSIDHLLPDDGYTVGFHVDIKHVAPATPGSRVKTTAELLEINETRLRFHVEARDIDTDKLIGIGTHRRAAIFP